MKTLKLFPKQFIMYFFFFVVVFLIFDVSACNLYALEAINLPYDYISIQNSSTFSEDNHHPSDSCHIKREKLANQDIVNLFLANNKIQNQNNQKVSPDFNVIISREPSDLARQKFNDFIFLENLEDSQTKQLLTVVKKE